MDPIFTKNRTHTSSWRELFFVFVAGLAVSLYAWWPIVAAYPLAQGGDGQFFQKMMEAAAVSVTRYREFPFWNPYECGGVPLWDNPQAPIGGPLMWSMFFVNTTLTMAVWYILHSAIGVVCMWRFAREVLELSREASIVASLVWAFCGFHQQHYGGGHLAFVPFLYFPLAWVLWRGSWTRLRDAVFLGMLVAWMFYEGAVYPLPHLALMLAACTVTGSIAKGLGGRGETAARPKSSATPPHAIPARCAFWGMGPTPCDPSTLRWRGAFRHLRAVALAAVVVVVVGVGLGAPRMLPVVDQLRAHTRPIGLEADSLQWATLRDMFLLRTHPYFVPAQDYVWTEYASYLGPVLLGFSAVGLLCGLTRKAWEVLVILGLFSLLMAGHFSAYAPWHLLKEHVFPFREMRVPSRFRVEVLMCLSAFVGIAVDRISALRLPIRPPGRHTGSMVRPLVLAIAFIGIGDMLGVGIRLTGELFNTPALIAHPAAKNFFYGGADLATDIRDQPQQNRGRLACWEEWAWGRTAPLWEGDLPQARSLSDLVTIKSVSRTQNTFNIVVDAPTGGDILLNSAFDRQWRSNIGTVGDDQTALKVSVPPGRHEVTVRYRPRLFTAGLGMFAVTLLWVFVFLWRDKTRTISRQLMG